MDTDGPDLLVELAREPQEPPRRVALRPAGTLRDGRPLRAAEDLTVGLSYEYLDLGSNKFTNTVPGIGTVSGKYDKNKGQFIALTLSKSF